jgi:hypothetical protein
VATVQRYVDTASSGGDGTTQGHSGATAAYASLSSWEANAGGSATDDYIVDCAGSAADTTAVTVDFATNITTGSVTIRGDRSAPDDDGFYDGNLTISTSHYRLVPGNVTRALHLSEERPTVDGIQIEAGSTGALGCAIQLNAGTEIAATNVTTIKNNRVRNASSTDYGIGAASGSNVLQRGTFNIENNLVVGFDVVGIEVGVATNFSPTVNVLHNTVYGDGTASTGILLEKAASTGTAIINVKGNASAGNGSGSDFDSSGLNNATLTTADNAFEDFDLGTTNEIDLGDPTDAWTSPGTTAASDFTVKNTSSALYNAVNPTLVSTDITDFTRDGTNHDVGAFELVVVGGSVRPKHLAMLGVS